MQLLLDTGSIVAISLGAGTFLTLTFLALSQYFGNNIASVWKALFVFLVPVTFYAIYKTGGHTILLGIPLCYILYATVLNRKIRAPSLSFKVDWQTVLAGILVAIFLIGIRIYAQYDFIKGTFLPMYSDEYIYAYIIKGMRDFGVEMPYAYLEQYIITGTKHASPYHYPDLWTVALFTEILPVSVLVLFQFVLYPFIQFLIYLHCYYLLLKKNNVLISAVCALLLVFIPGFLFYDNAIGKAFGLDYFLQFVTLTPTCYEGNLKVSILVLFFFGILHFLLDKKYKQALLISCVALYVNYIMLPFVALIWVYIVFKINWPDRIRYAIFLVGSLLPILLLYYLFKETDTTIIVYKQKPLLDGFKHVLIENNLLSFGGALSYTKTNFIKFSLELLVHLYLLIFVLIVAYLIKGKGYLLRLIVAPTLLFPILIHHITTPYMFYLFFAVLIIYYSKRRDPLVQIGGIVFVFGIFIFFLTKVFLVNVMNAFQIYLIVFPAFIWAIGLRLLVRYIDAKKGAVALPFLLLFIIDYPKQIRWTATEYFNIRTFLTPQKGAEFQTLIKPNDRIGFLEPLPYDGYGGHMIFFDAWFTIYSYTNAPTLHPVQWGDLRPIEQAGLIKSNGTAFQQASSSFQFVQRHKELNASDATVVYIKQNRINWILADDAYLQKDYAYLLPHLKPTGYTQKCGEQLFSFYKVLHTK